MPEKDASYTAESLQFKWIRIESDLSDVEYEMEVYYEGKWVELLGCGVINYDTIISAGVPSRLGWSFGIGLDRVAMILFRIPEMRLLWSQDKRFLDQFKGFEDNGLKHFVPYTDHAGCYKDVIISLPSAEANSEFHEGNIMEMVRDAAADEVMEVKLLRKVDNPQTAKCSLYYRIKYRRLDRELTDVEIGLVHEKIKMGLKSKLGAEICSPGIGTE